MFRKHVLILIITLVILSGIPFAFWYSQPKTPLIALEKYSENENSIKFSSLIKQVDISPDESLIFYYNGNGNSACAVAKKTFGYCKIINISSELACESSTLRTGMIGSGFEDGNTWKCLIWGIVYDKSVEKIVNDNIVQTKVNTPNFEMFYYINDGILKFDYHLYNSKGNELELQFLNNAEN